MREVKTDNHGPATKELLALAAGKLPASLNFGAAVKEAHAILRAMTDQTISQNRRVRMPHDAACLHAGLWLLFDYMEESHAHSQDTPTPSGSYWHAILHRREPDPGNAKYWFARIGEHPILPELLQDAKELAAGSPLALALEKMAAWDSGWFVDRCSGGNDAAVEAVLLKIQRREWDLLFEYNFKKAFA
jgi:hypothetical protein